MIHTNAHIYIYDTSLSLTKMYIYAPLYDADLYLCSHVR